MYWAKKINDLQDSIEVRSCIQHLKFKYLKKSVIYGGNSVTPIHPKKKKKGFHTLKLWLIILASSRKVASILLHIEYYYYYYSKTVLLVPKIYSMCVISLSSFKRAPMVPKVLKVGNTSSFVNCHRWCCLCG